MKVRNLSSIHLPEWARLGGACFQLELNQCEALLETLSAGAPTQQEIATFSVVWSELDVPMTYEQFVVACRLGLPAVKTALERLNRRFWEEDDDSADEDEPWTLYSNIESQLPRLRQTNLVLIDVPPAGRRRVIPLRDLEEWPTHERRPDSHLVLHESRPNLAGKQPRSYRYLLPNVALLAPSESVNGAEAYMPVSDGCLAALAAALNKQQ